MKRYALTLTILTLIFVIMAFCLEVQYWGQEATPTGIRGSETPPASSDSSFEARAKEFILKLDKNLFEEAYNEFDDTMKKKLSVEKLQEMWKEVFKRFGSVKKMGKTIRAKVDKYNRITINVEFQKNVLDIAVVFDGAGKIAGLWLMPSSSAVSKIPYKTPSYVKTDSFTEVEVKIGEGEWVLPGTLTIPKGKAPFPAVILVHGSGPNDRDESIGPNRVFKDLAWGLATRGIAILRYDKRTRAHPMKFLSLKSYTVKDEVIDDVYVAVAFLKKRKEAGKIFVLGHSLGGMLIPRISTGNRDIAGFIVMAGATRPLEDLIVEQYTYIFSLDGKITDEEKANLEKIKEAIAKVKDPKLDENTPVTDLPLGIPAFYWLDLKSYKPAQMAKKMKEPILVLQGERDYQVTLKDYEGWKKALSSHKNVKFKLYPKLNHLFMPGKGKSSPEEYMKVNHVDVEVIEDISKWVKGNI